MLNNFSVMGVIRDVEAPTKPGAAALVTLQNAENRISGHTDKFTYLNEVLVRVPAAIYNNSKEELKSGEKIVVQGRLQGVRKKLAGNELMISELVAQRVDSEKLNHFTLIGEVKGKYETPGENGSLHVLIEYGTPRNIDPNSPVQFVNANVVKVTEKLREKVEGYLEVGENVIIHGRLQGYSEKGMEDSFKNLELVALRVEQVKR